MASFNRSNVWSAINPNGSSCELHNVGNGMWEMIMSAGSCFGYQIVVLDETQLKDLLDTIGNEINAF